MRLGGFTLALCLLLSRAGLAGEWDAAPASLSKVLQSHAVAPGQVGIYVQAVDAAKPLLSINASAPMHPASAIKLVTTWLSLDELGPAWVWPTEVYLQGTVENGTLHGDLILKGYGDPYMVTERLWLLQRQLRLRGIHHINGDLIIDNGFFATSHGDPAGFDGEGLRVYNVLPDAMLVNFQAVRLVITPDPDKAVVRVTADPMPTNLQLENKLRLSQGRCRGLHNGVTLQLVGGAERNRLIVSGDYATACGQYSLTRSVLTGPGYAYGVFRSLWEESGGTLGGRLRVDPHALAELPAETAPFLRVESPPLADVVKSINKFSNNVMARQLFLTLGAEVFGEPASLGKSRRAAQLVLRQRGMPFADLYLDNGAGLSRDTRIAAASLGKLLLAASRSAWMPEYAASLPLAGMDGTLKKRFRHEPATGHMHLKTGRLDDVFATAGYVHASSGRDYVVVLLENFPRADRGPGEAAQSALLRWVYEQ